MKKVLLAVIAIISFAFTSYSQNIQRQNNGSHGASGYEPCGKWTNYEDKENNCDGNGPTCYCMSTIIIYSQVPKTPKELQNWILSRNFRGMDTPTAESIKTGRFKIKTIENKHIQVIPTSITGKGIILHFN